MACPICKAPKPFTDDKIPVTGFVIVLAKCCGEPLVVTATAVTEAYAKHAKDSFGNVYKKRRRLPRRRFKPARRVSYDDLSPSEYAAVWEAAADAVNGGNAEQLLSSRIHPERLDLALEFLAEVLE